MYCENCLRTGHTAKFCVVNPRCIKCGEAHTSKNCQSNGTDFKCQLCNLAHDLNNRKLCPKISAANVKYQLAAQKRLQKSYAEAVRGGATGNGQNNCYAILSSADEDHEDQGEQKNESTPSDANKRRRKVPKVSLKQLNIPSSDTKQAKQVLSRDPSQQSTSQVKKPLTGNLSVNSSGPQNSSKKTPQKKFFSGESIAYFLKPIIVNCVSQSELSTDIKNLLVNLTNFFFDNVFPYCLPILEQLICNLMCTSKL